MLIDITLSTIEDFKRAVMEVRLDDLYADVLPQEPILRWVHKGCRNDELRKVHFEREAANG